MRHGYARALVALLVILLISLTGFAQQDNKKRLYAPSLDGATGLFRAWDAESLRQGETSFSIGYNHYNRDPGELVIKTIPLAFSVGIIDRLEIFGSMDVMKDLRAPSVKTYRLLPGQLPRPAQALSGGTNFSNEAPFLDVYKANGRGDFRLGGKFAILSERAGQPFSMAFAAFLALPPDNSITGLNRGLGRSGKISGGIGTLFSKRAGNVARFHLNTLFNFLKDPEINGNELANLQHEFWYRGGASFPSYGAVTLIAELDGTMYFGSRTFLANPRSPLDIILGLRFYPADWASVGLGYRATLNHVKEDVGARVYPAGTNGMVAQFSLGTRKNDPPTVTCAVATPSIKQDDKTTIRASAVDPNGDPVTITWSASGGKVTGSGDTAEFDATGIAPGRYTVTATASDGKLSGNCTVEITVIKKNLPPTVTCQPTSASVTQGQSTTIRATASDPNNDPLTYAWTVNGQKVAADGPSMTFGSEGRNPGNYTVAVTVSDGEFTATCSSTVTVIAAPKPNSPPRIECLTTTIDVASGSSATLSVRASDPDNDRVTVTWSATGGAVRGSADTGTFDASGVKAGSYTVTATADDGRGGRSSCSMTVNVSERLTLASFGRGSARLDNLMKATLDDLATRMTSDSRLKANIIGYNEGTKAEPRKIGQRRAEAVAAYLKKKGVEESRLTVTDGGSSNLVGDVKKAAGRKLNRRVEIELTVR